MKNSTENFSGASPETCQPVKMLLLWAFAGLMLCSAALYAADDHSRHVPATPVPSLPANNDEVKKPVQDDVFVYPSPTQEQQQSAFPDLGGMSMADHMASRYYGKVLIDRLEAQDADAHAALVWDARASWGRDFDKVTLSSEGERVAGAAEHGRTELFWSHALVRWWDSTLGLRQDNGRGPDRHWIAVGMQGLAPYFVELRATAYAGEAGRSALRLEAEYAMRITNALILQPRLELNAHGRNDAENGIGKGLSESAFGLRLRYEIRREMAPYIGVEWSRKYGDTATMAEVSGARTGEARALAGVRVWF